MVLQDLSTQLTELHRISIDLSKSQSFDELCYKAIESGLSCLGFERLSFWYVDKDNLNYLKGSFGTDEKGRIRDERDIRILITENNLSDSLQAGELFINYQKDHPLRNHLGEIIGRGDIAIAGLWDGNKYIGCIIADNFLSKKEIDQTQRDLLLIYGRTLGNLSTLKLAEEDLKSHERFERILKEITRVSIEQTDIRQMVHSLENLLRHLFRGISCRIYLRDQFFSSIFTYTDREMTLFQKYRNLNDKLILSDIEGFSSILLLPITSADKHNGLILITLDKEKTSINQEMGRAEQVVWQISLAVQKARLFEETRKLSTIDELTGISNRRHLFQLAEREIARSLRKKSALSLIMVDIDSFKPFNDTFGHLSGDKVLRAVADKLQDGLRDMDILGRYGGEEFVIILPDTDREKAWTAAQRLLMLVREMDNPLTGSGMTLTISAGISFLSQKDPRLKKMLDEADIALYKAKNQGRNCSVIFSDK
jgi:diguanylate cyclase (GGDEF)-like protein